MAQEKIIQLAHWYQQAGPLNWATGASKLIIYLPRSTSERDRALFMLLASWFPSQSHRLADAEIRMRTSDEAEVAFFDPPIYVQALCSDGYAGHEQPLQLTIRYRSGENIQIPDDWIKKDIQALTERKIWARAFDKPPLRLSEEGSHSRPVRPLRPRYRPFHYPPTNAKRRGDDDGQRLPPDVAARLRTRKMSMEQLKQ